MNLQVFSSACKKNETDDGWTCLSGIISSTEVSSPIFTSCSCSLSQKSYE